MLRLDVTPCIDPPPHVKALLSSSSPTKIEATSLCKKFKGNYGQLAHNVQTRYIEHFLRCYASGPGGIAPTALRNLQNFIFSQPTEIAELYQRTAIQILGKEQGLMSQGGLGGPPLSPRTSATLATTRSTFVSQLRRSLFRRKGAAGDTQREGAGWVTADKCHHTYLYAG